MVDVEGNETPNTNGNGHKLHFDILKEAKEQGIADTYREVAHKLKIAPTTLSNIVHDRSKGSAKVRRKMEKLFGKPLERLGDGLAPGARPKGKVGRPRKSQQKQSELNAKTADRDYQLTPNEAFQIAMAFNPALKRAAKQTLQDALQVLD